MEKQWEVNHIGEEKKCPTCGHSLGFSGSSEDAVSKQEKGQEPPPCSPQGEMDVWADLLNENEMEGWTDEESDVQC